jgi:hypothetical protein
MDSDNIKEMVIKYEALIRGVYSNKCHESDYGASMRNKTYPLDELDMA